MASAASLIGHVVDPAKVAIEEEHSDGAEEREQSNGGTDPQSKRI